MMILLNGVGKRQHAAIYRGKEKRRLDRENKPFTPWLTVDIETGHVEQHRDIWQRERSVGEMTPEWLAEKRRIAEAATDGRIYNYWNAEET